MNNKINKDNMNKEMSSTCDTLPGAINTAFMQQLLTGKRRVFTWEKINRNGSPYSQERQNEILNFLIVFYEKNKDYLDENFKNDLDLFKNKKQIYLYNNQDQKFVTRLFEARVFEYLKSMGADFEKSLKVEEFINAYKKVSDAGKINYPDFLIKLNGKKYFVEATMPTRDKIIENAMDIFDVGENCYQDILLLLGRHDEAKKKEKWRKSYTDLISMCCLYPELEKQRYQINKGQKQENIIKFSQKDFINACCRIKSCNSSVGNYTLNHVISVLTEAHLITKAGDSVVLSGDDYDFKAGRPEYTIKYQLRNKIEDKLDKEEFKKLSTLMCDKGIGYILALSTGLIAFFNTPIFSLENIFESLFEEKKEEVDFLLTCIGAEGLLGDDRFFRFFPQLGNQ